MLRLFSRSKHAGNGSNSNGNGNGNGNGLIGSNDYSSSSPSLSTSSIHHSGKRIRGVSSSSRKANESLSRPSGSPLKSNESTLLKIARHWSFSSSSSSTTSASASALPATTATYVAGGSASSTGAAKGILNGLKASSSGAAQASSQMKGRNKMRTVKEMSISSGSAHTTSASSSSSSSFNSLHPSNSTFSMECSDDDHVIVTDAETVKLVHDLGKDTADIVIRITEEYQSKCLHFSMNDLPTMSMTTLMLCGQCVPPISLSHYISRIIRNINHALGEKNNNLDSIGVRCLLIAVIYINRLQQNVKDFQLNMLNIHRLFLIAMTDALKVNEDEHPDNKYMALVGGLDCAQLNSIEITFCIKNGFDLVVTFEELQDMYRKYHKQSYILTVPENQHAYPVRRVSWESKQ